MVTKNKEEVRLKSGNNFKLKFGSTWYTLGNIISGKITKVTSSTEVTFADGESFEKKTTTKSMTEVVLGQVSKEILDNIDTYGSAFVKLYYYNGIANGKDMEFYIPEAELIENLELDMKGNSHQIIALKFSNLPQAANATVTPSTDLPAGAYATSGSFQTGTNPYYVVLDTLRV